MGYFLLLSIGFFQLFLSVLITYENRRSKQKQGQWILILISITLLIYNFASIILQSDSRINNSNELIYEIANRVAFSLGYIAIALIYAFSFQFPIKQLSSYKQKMYMLANVLYGLLAATSPIAGFYALKGDGSIGFTGGDLVITYSIFALLLIVMSLRNIARAFKMTNDVRKRRQAKTVIVGLVLSAAHGLLFVIILPTVLASGEYNTPLLNTIYLIGFLYPYWYLGGVTYSIFRQQLFDIRSIVVNLVASVLTVLALAAIFALVVVQLVGSVLNVEVGRSQEFVFAAAIFLSLLIYPYVRKTADRVSEKLFYQNRYDPKTVLDQLSEVVVHNIELRILINHGITLISTTFKPESTGIYLLGENGREAISMNLKFTPSDFAYISNIIKLLPEEDAVLLAEAVEDISDWKQLKKLNIDALVVLRSSGSTLGFIALGPKQSGASYNNLDKTVLGTLANELTVGLQNAFRFEEIQQFNVTLQQKIEDATAKLQKSNQKLKELDEAKDEFISMASHQLRTPLTSMKGYVSMVLEGDSGKINDMQRKLLDQAFVSSQRMVYLIADLLNVSRLKTGKFIIEGKPTDLGKVVEEEVSQLVETAKSRNLELTYDKPKDFPLLMLDETKIRQVIMNFTDNAIYYTPAGGHIHVYLEDTGQTIECRVEDDGLGVPKAEQHHLFTKFYRAGNAKKARPDGTGLGLFMAKKVIAAQGGTIIFRSTEGKGSTFGFSFSKSKLKPTPEQLKATAPTTTIVAATDAPETAPEQKEEKPPKAKK